jgi:GMP synthase-like glutamine amidotransferase
MAAPSLPAAVGTYARGVQSALVIANRGDDDPGLVGERLSAHDYELVTVIREADDPWPAPHSVDLVVVLGSEWSVYWATVRAPVERELAFVAGAVEADVPLLGICFGAQIVAASLGGTVTPAERPELGWLGVEPVADAPPDDRSIEPGPWFQWHRDTFTLPPRADLLARSEVGPQAFRVGSALAVQFHPEVTPEIVGRWAASDPAPLERAGLDATTIVARTAAEQERVRVATARLVDRFLYGGPKTRGPR